MKMKKILSASLAVAMLLSYAPTAYAADPVAIIDPLGTVYEMGSDNILRATDGTIGHGENFYVMLVDESTYSPTDIKSDDLRSLRVYTDLKVGEDYVTGEEIIYKKAEDVLVKTNTSIANTYALSVALNMPGETTAFTVVDGITKTDGTGYTELEIATFTDAEKREIAERAIDKYKLETTSDRIRMTMLSLTHNSVQGGFLSNGQYFIDEATMLANLPAIKISADTGYKKYDDGNGNIYYTKGLTETPQHGHEAISGSNMLHRAIINGVEVYSKSHDVLEKMSFDHELTLTNGAVERIPSSPTFYYDSESGNQRIGYTKLTGQHYVTNLTPPTYKSPLDYDGINDIVGMPYLNIVAATELNTELNNNSSWGIYNSDGSTPTASNRVLLSTAPSGAFTTKITTLPTNGYFIKASESTNEFTYQTADIHTLVSADSDYDILKNGDEYVVAAVGTYENVAGGYELPGYKAPNRYTNETDALDRYNILTQEITSGYFRVADGVYFTQLADIYQDLAADEIKYTSVSAANKHSILSTDVIGVLHNQYVWQHKTDNSVLTTQTEIANTTDANFATARATAEMTATKSAAIGTAEVPIAGTATLTGTDYYYFVELQTKSYTGANSYDVAGSISVGKSTSDAEDRGSAAINITLSTGEYGGGAAQSGDIEIDGETGAIVQFEEDAGEIYIHWGENAMFIVNVSGQDDLNLAYNRNFDSYFADRHGYANIDFINFLAQPRFNRNGEFYIYADENMYIYQLNEDGYAEEISGLEYDEDEEAWTFRTNQLTSYVISDEELVLTDEQGNITQPEDAQPSPTITSHIDGKVNPATGR